MWGIALVFLLPICIAQPVQVNSLCPSFTGNSITTVGWPVAASCDEYFYNYVNDDYFDPGDEVVLEFVCEIYMGDEKVGSYNGLYDLEEDVYTSTPFQLDALMENMTLFMNLTSTSYCAAITHDLIAIDEDFRYQDNCLLYTETAQADNSFSESTIECNDRLLVDCGFGISDDEIPIHLTNPDSYEITWYRDCVPLASGEYRELSDVSSRLFSKIEVLGDFANFSGTYTCQLSYNGMSRFISQHKTCVSQPRPVRHDELIEPQSLKKEANIGDDVLLQCSGSGVITDERYKVDRLFRWYKLMENGESEEICRMEQKIGGSNVTLGEKYHCTELSDAKPPQLFCESSPICKEFKNLTETFKTTLLIRNLDATDLGRYHCSVRTLQANDTADLSLLLAPETPPVEYLSIILGVVAAFLLCIILGSMVAWLFKTEIQLVWKKCCAAYDHDRSYAAYLAYSFTKGDDDDATLLFLRSLHQWFEDNCYDVYDEQKENTSDLRFESVTNVAPTCHRMVVVLTTTFFQSDDTLFDVHRGIIESISGRTSLIFILLPEARRILNEKIKSEKGSTYRSLIAAMNAKGNDVIFWKGQSRKSRFFKKLEVAMPKLRTPAYVINNSSCASENELSDHVCRDRLRTVSSTLSDVPPSIV